MGSVKMPNPKEVACMRKAGVWQRCTSCNAVCLRDSALQRMSAVTVCSRIGTNARMENGSYLLKIQQRMSRFTFKRKTSGTASSPCGPLVRFKIHPSGCEMIGLIGAALSPCCVLNGKYCTPEWRGLVLRRHPAA